MISIAYGLHGGAAGLVSRKIFFVVFGRLNARDEAASSLRPCP
jgi:hypothetical protein